MPYQPVMRAETPEEAVQKYLEISTDNPLIDFHGIEIAVIFEPHGVGNAVLHDNVGIIVDDAGEGMFRLVGWVHRTQHRDGLWMYPFPMERSIYSFWCFAEAATGTAYRDWGFIDTRKKKQERRKVDHVPADSKYSEQVNTLIEFWGANHVDRKKRNVR